MVNVHFTVLGEGNLLVCEWEDLRACVRACNDRIVRLQLELWRTNIYHRSGALYTFCKWQ